MLLENAAVDVHQTRSPVGGGGHRSSAGGDQLPARRSDGIVEPPMALSAAELI